MRQLGTLAKPDNAIQFAVFRGSSKTEILAIPSY